MKKVKILFLIGSFGVGGKERQLAEIIKHISKDKFEVYLFTKTLKAHYLSKEIVEENIKDVFIVDRKNFKVSDISILVKYINKIEPDVVFSFSSTLAHFALVAKVFTSTSFILVNGSIRDAPRIFNIKRRIEKFLYSFYKYVVSNSFAGLKAFGEDNKKGHYVLYNGFETSRIQVQEKIEARRILGLKKDTFIVSMIAAISDRKDHITFLNGAKKVLEIKTNIQFLVVGDGKERKNLETLSLQLGISNEVHFLGERSDVETVLIASDVSVLTSAAWHGEGISNSIMESMACGIPVIATDNGGTKEIIEQNKSGYIIDVGSSNQLAEKILYLETNELVRKNFSSCSKTIVANKFSMPTMINNFEKIILEICSNPK